MGFCFILIFIFKKIQTLKKFLKIIGAFSLMEISRQDIAQSSEMALLA